jgi:hypothetical protein
MILPENLDLDHAGDGNDLNQVEAQLDIGGPLDMI